MVLGPLWIIKMMSSEGQFYLTNVSPFNPLFQNENECNICEEFFYLFFVMEVKREEVERIVFGEVARSMESCLRCWKGLCVEFIPELCVCILLFG